MRVVLPAATVVVCLTLSLVATADEFHPPADCAWTFEARGAVRGGPIVVDRCVYVGSEDGAVYVVRLADGTPVWTASLGAPITGALAVGGGRVYAGTQAGHLVCLRPPAVREGIVGVETWRFGASAPITTPPLVTQRGLVIFGARDGACYALDMRGRPVWQANTGGSVAGAPVGSVPPKAWTKTGKRSVHSPLVYLASADGRVHALREEDGQSMWTFATGAELSGGVTCLRTAVIAGNEAGTVVALEPTSGRAIWTRDIGAPIKTAPGVADGRIFLCCDNGTVVALSLETGEPVWDAETRGSVTGSPVLTSSGHLLATSADGMLYALRRRDGRVVWAENVREGISTPAVAAREFLVFGTGKGTVMGYLPGGGWHIDPPPTSGQSTEPAPAPATSASAVDAPGPEMRAEEVVMSLLTASDDPTQPSVQVADRCTVQLVGTVPGAAIQIMLNDAPVQIRGGQYQATLQFDGPGTYPVTLTCLDEEARETVEQRIVVIGSSEGPGSSAPVVVSPEHRSKISFTLAAATPGQQEYISVLSIRDGSGAAIRAWADTSQALRTFEWDGTDQWGNALADGEYVAVYTLRDMRGRTRSVYQPLVVDTAGM